MIHSSQFWYNHFESNLKLPRIDWDTPPAITEEEKSQVLYSLKAWQLGETSDGSHLLAAAIRYAEKQGDAAYPAAVQLFIREEQKHGNNLGRYLEAIGEE
ncbi:MAG: ferritin-like domain-containing protein, partial [Bacteroidota bacterium]